MTDRHAVVWTEAPSGAVKMGSLVFTGTECRFVYDANYAARGHAGLSLVMLPEDFTARPFIQPTDALTPFLPRLMTYVPGHGDDNIQRRVYTALLRDRNFPTEDAHAVDWEIMMLAGRNGIGHFDVFRSDLDAQAYYQQPHGSHEAVSNRSVLWNYIRREIGSALSPDEARQIVDLLGATPSADGMIPKLLVAIPDRNEWDGRVAAPGTREIDGQRYTDVLLKIEPERYPGVARLEALCYDVHRSLGFDTPRVWQRGLDGMDVLAVERFDRDHAGRRLPLESVFSIFATARLTGRQSDIEMEQLGVHLGALRELGIDPRPIRHEVFRRFVAAVYTGNGDLHLKNLSLLGAGAETRVSPVYDPAPMRAYDRHNLLSALPFDPSHKHGLRAAIARLGVRGFGLTPQQAGDVIGEIDAGTRDYPEQLATLALHSGSAVSARDKLIERVNNVRGKMNVPGKRLERLRRERRSSEPER